MDQSINVSIVKNYFRILYSDYTRKDEAEEFFKMLIDSESNCSSLLELLIEIIIEDPDESMKKMSVIIINQMSPDLIINSIFLLNQKADPNFYKMIEILTDFIAAKKSLELISLINETLSKSDDILIIKAILQLISSINFKIESNEIEIENYEKYLSIYYEHLKEMIDMLMQQETIDLNQQVIIYYFLKSFFKIILHMKDIEFFYPFAFYCLCQKLNDDLFKEIIEMVVEIYSYLITDTDFSIYEFIELFDDYCKSTDFIPNSSLYLWAFFFKFIPEIDLESFDVNYFISNYIFPFFKFQPQLMIENTDKFLDEFDPDVFSDLYLRKFINNFVTSIKFEPFYDFIYQFSNAYFLEYIDSDPCEVCRILHFFSTFHQSLCDTNKPYLINFLIEKIPLLIERIDGSSEYDSYLIISICLFIKRVINYSTSSLLEESNITEMIITFLKGSITVDFDFNQVVSDLIFYFSINAIVSVSRAASIELFEFTGNESEYILTNVCRLYNEISNNTLSATFDFLIENISLMNINIQEFIKNIWEMRNENGFFINDNIFHVLTTLFINCNDVENKQDIFMVLCVIISNEIESSDDHLIEQFYLDVLYLIVQTFTSALLDDCEKVPFFIDSVGKMIYQMLFNINAENYPFYLEDSEGFDILVSRYKYFIIELVQYIEDPYFCLNSLIDPFVIPIFIKLNELSNIRGFEINFTGFNCLLIKFKENEDIFHLLFSFYNDFVIQSNLNQYSKSNFLTCLVISQPSLLFQSYDQEFFFEVINEYFLHLKFDIHLYVIKELLEFLSRDQEPNIELISIVAQSFYNRIENDELVINGEFEIQYQPKSASYHYHIYADDIVNVFSIICQILREHGIQMENFNS